MGTAALVLGLLAALTGWIPIVGIVAWPLSILGLAFGITGIRRASRSEATDRAQAIAGTVLAGLGLIFCLIYVAVFAA